MISKKLKKGDWVEGPLIPKDMHGTVVEVGEYEDLEQYDDQGVMRESIRFMGNIPCVAVKMILHGSKRIAVYPLSEVWKV